MVEMTLELGLEGTAGFHSMESFLGRQSSVKVLAPMVNTGLGAGAQDL